MKQTPRTRTLRFTVSGETGEDAAEFARVVTNVFMAYHKEVSRGESRPRSHEPRSASMRPSTKRKTRCGATTRFARSMGSPISRPNSSRCWNRLRSFAPIASLPSRRSVRSRPGEQPGGAAREHTKDQLRRWRYLAGEGHVRATSAGAGQRKSHPVCRSPAGPSASAAGRATASSASVGRRLEPPAARPGRRQRNLSRPGRVSFERRNRVLRAASRTPKRARPKWPKRAQNRVEGFSGHRG